MSAFDAGDAVDPMRRVAEAAEYRRLSYGTEMAIVAQGLMANVGLMSRILELSNPRHSGINHARLLEVSAKSGVDAASLLESVRVARRINGDTREPQLFDADVRIESLKRLKQAGLTTDTSIGNVIYLLEQLRLLNNITGIGTNTGKNALDFLEEVWLDRGVSFSMRGHVVERDETGSIMSDRETSVTVSQELTGQATPGRRHDPVVRVVPMKAGDLDFSALHDEELADAERPSTRAHDAVTSRAIPQPPHRNDRREELAPIDMNDIREILDFTMNTSAIRAGNVYNAKSAMDIVNRYLRRMTKGETVLSESDAAPILRAINCPRGGKKNNYQVRAAELATLLYIFHPDNRSSFLTQNAWRRVYDVAKFAYEDMQQ